jgi:phosphatidylglycerophosphate synthase
MVADQLTAARAQPSPAQGRPREIEEALNFHVIHPMSRAVATALIPTGVSPNTVSALGVVMMALACACYLSLPWPWAALVGFLFHVGWHVFDGADGDLARRTGRSSTNGEIVDGVCDHLSHLILYLTLGWLVSRQLGGWAWAVTAASAASRALHATAYESARRNYRRWVHNVGWLRQNLGAAERTASASLWGRLSTGLGRIYLGMSRLVSADDREVDAAMAAALASGGARAEAARKVYAARQRPLVKLASALSTNWETVGVFLSLLAGSGLYFLVFQAVALNLVMAAVVLAERRNYARIVGELEAL